MPLKKVQWKMQKFKIHFLHSQKFVYVYTGCFIIIIIEKKSEPIAVARKIPIRWKRCYFLHWTDTFWYLSSQKYHRQSVIIHIWKRLRCIMVKIWKMHWKLTSTEWHYHFVNNFVSKAHILKNHRQNFCEDPCMHMCVRGG